ncbi:MAG: hypothetical protein EOP08_09830 [Proteobacteria bacterium]|nr:MAG: hypothetical protein EOP08_09830 [Pseudomonadota bacterium]
MTLQPDVQTAMLGLSSTSGPTPFERFVYPGAMADEIGLAVESPELALEAVGPDTGLVLAVGSTSAVLAAMFQAHGQEALRVHGTVRGPSAGGAVYAADELGATQARALVDAGGGFELVVPRSVGRFFAQTASARAAVGDEAPRTSMVTTFEPGVPWPLLLDLEPAGTCTVHVFDGESDRPLTARLIVRGVGDTRDPWFGPDYRASGAGPIADLRDGTAEIDLPAGTYRVQATHGPMYSIDEVQLTVRSGAGVEATLRPRRVIPGLGLLSSDLHVHARPSYDSPVQAEDRVLSLVAAGVEFAVPTEHNVVGDYESALSFTGQEASLRFVPGVEVTTFAPKLGHFGVFPYPVDQKVPPYRGTSLAALFAAVRTDPGRVLVVHHPFLGHGMGYFDRDPRVAPERGAFGGLPLGFDAIELLNGYETLDAASLERTLAAWFGHRILYGWAGYPRTLIRVQDTGVPDLATLDLKNVTTALRGGRAQATTGPVVEVSVAGASPGETVKVSGKTVPVHVVVRAAPWIEVTRLDVYVGGLLATSVPIEPVGLRVGPERGTDDEVFARSVRLVRDLELAAPTGPSSVVVVVRGEKKLEWVLPATALPPIAIANPVWLR